jgi:hypothetical protein
MAVVSFKELSISTASVPLDKRRDILITLAGTKASYTVLHFTHLASSNILHVVRSVSYKSNMAAYGLFRDTIVKVYCIFIGSCDFITDRKTEND